MKNTSTGNLAALENELAVYYAAIGILLEECYMPDSGKRALGLPVQEGLGGMAVRLNVRATHIGRMLPLWNRYAYEGVLSAGYSAEDVQDEGPLERLRDMLYLLRTDDPYFQLCLDAAQSSSPLEVTLGGLLDMVERVHAREALDSGSSLSVEYVSLLANMSERSVRNAMGPGGDLKVEQDGCISNADAVRWLRGRRGFTPTQQRQLPSNQLELPDALDAVEIPPFVAQRLRALWTPSSENDNSMGNYSGFPAWIAAASNECGLSMERLQAATELPLDILPQECDKLAVAMRVDRVWLTHQVMAGLFPDQVDMLLNPKAWDAASEESAHSHPGTAVTVTLTDKMLANGYIDMPMSAKTLFPEDCFGGRGGGDEGAQVVLVYGSHRNESDIRIKSAKTLSPRRRFTAWLNTELGARPGDRIRIDKTGEREFTLTHVTN